MPETVPLHKGAYVNVYEVDRGYGGPEEGGWWYDTGEVVDVARCAPESAQHVAEQLREMWPSTGDSSSVAYRGGDYRVYVEDKPGESFPKESPRYE